MHYIYSKKSSPLHVFVNKKLVLVETHVRQEVSHSRRLSKSTDSAAILSGTAFYAGILSMKVVISGPAYRFRTGRCVKTIIVS